jgi:hypothetical protein
MTALDRRIGARYVLSTRLHAGNFQTFRDSLLIALFQQRDGCGVCYSWWKGRRPSVMGAPQKQRSPSQVLLMSSGDLPPTANEPRTTVPVFVPVETAVVHRIDR